MNKHRHKRNKKNEFVHLANDNGFLYIFFKQFSNEASWLIDNDNLDQFVHNITYPVWLFVFVKMQKSVISLEWL